MLCVPQQLHAAAQVKHQKEKQSLARKLRHARNKLADVLEIKHRDRGESANVQLSTSQSMGADQHIAALNFVVLVLKVTTSSYV